MKIRTLTQHFVENWRARVGQEPSLGAVRDILRSAVPVQRGARFLLNNFHTHIQLGIFWRPDLDIVLLIDEINDTAVSVLSIVNFEQCTRRQRGVCHDQPQTAAAAR